MTFEEFAEGCPPKSEDGGLPYFCNAFNMLCEEAHCPNWYLRGTLGTETLVWRNPDGSLRELELIHEKGVRSVTSSPDSES